MTVRIICDGCDGSCEHYPKDGKLTEFGYETRRYYCEFASKIIGKYLEDREELHAKATKVWEKGYPKLKDIALKELPAGGLLPDDG